MSKISTVIVLGALAGVGYYFGKKVFEKKKAEKENPQPEVYVEERHSSPKEKLQRASLFAVGAIKTGTEKFKESVDEIVNQDMVAKGETTVSDVKNFAKETKDKTVAFAKDKTSAIKEEIENLKGMVTSINAGAGEAEESAAETAESQEAQEDQEVQEETAENAEAPEESASAVSEEVKDAVSEAADEIDSLSFDDGETVSVDTFDFSSADKL